MQPPNADQRASPASESHRAAFTLVELVQVLAVMGIIGITTSFVFLEAMRVYARTAPRLEASYQANLAVEGLRRDVRAMLGPDWIAAMTADTLGFLDLDGNKVLYEHSGGELRRNGQLLATGLSGFGFRYLQQDASVATSPGQVHLVGVDLVVVRGDQKVPASTLIFPRVLGL